MDVIECSARSCRYFPLKKEQRGAVDMFLKGKDVFVCLPTGFGKSACYGILPKAFDLINGTSRSIVVVVSPLSALMRDQVATFNSKGVSSAFVNSETESRANYEKVRQGGFHLVFISPECLLLNRMWRDILLTDVYRMHLMALVPTA